MSLGIKCRPAIFHWLSRIWWPQTASYPWTRCVPVVTFSECTVDAIFAQGGRVWHGILSGPERTPCFVKLVASAELDNLTRVSKDCPELQIVPVVGDPVPVSGRVAVILPSLRTLRDLVSEGSAQSWAPVVLPKLVAVMLLVCFYWFENPLCRFGSLDSKLRLLKTMCL